LFWLLSFGFGLGFGTTVAEPALIAVSEEAAGVMSGAGFIAVLFPDETKIPLVLEFFPWA
jgi:hypothetical protein